MKKIVSKKVLVLFVGLLFIFANTPVYSQANFPDQALLKKAQAGDVQAQVEVGKIYLSGAKGLPVDYFTAYDWFHKAELKNDAEAFYQIGRMHHNGRIGPLEIYTRIFDEIYAGVFDKNNHLKFQEGYPGANINYQKALTWYMKAAELNHAGAQYAIATIHAMTWQNGREVRPNVDEAMNWYRKAADNGNGDAMYALYRIYTYGWSSDGRMFVNANKNEAAKWYDKYSKALNEDRNPLLVRADELSNGNKKQKEERVRLLLEAAEQNDVDAMNLLGRAYEEGQGVKKDRIEATKWYRRAAENGDAEMQFRVGGKFEYGILGAKGRDFAEAAKWFRRAAENGDAEMQFRVGWKFENGLLGQKKGRDLDEAVKWYRAAGENGNAMMAYRVATKFFEGRVGIESGEAMQDRMKQVTYIKRSNAEAFKWYYKVATEGRSMLTPINHYPYDDLWFINAEQVVQTFYLEGKVVEKDEKAAEKWGFTIKFSPNESNDDKRLTVIYAFFRRAKEIDDEWNARWRQIIPQ